MSNSKFASPATVGFLIVLAIMFFSRIILIGSLYLLAFAQMATPHIIQFVKTQLGSPVSFQSPKEPSLATVDLQSAFNEIGVVEEIRKRESASHYMIELADSTYEMLELDISCLIVDGDNDIWEGTEGLTDDDQEEPDQISLSESTILATEMVLSALKTPKRTKSKSNKIVESGKIENRPRKYLTAKEKLAEQNWNDRNQTTDWNDKDCWLA